MPRVGQARRRDVIEPAVVDALRQIGVWVHRLSEKGLPDLLCHTPQHGFRLLEVKSAAGKLTPAQTETQFSVPFDVVRSVAEALALYGVKP